MADTRDAKLRDKIAFVRAIAKRQDIIFCDAVGFHFFATSSHFLFIWQIRDRLIVERCEPLQVNSKTKEEAWREVAKEVEDLGLKSFAGN